MNEPSSSPERPAGNPGREEMLSALFANMVIQQTNMAMMLLGKVAHPETGQFMQDIDSARMFIDQLEMIEAKTKGNLNKQEEGLLKQALSALHMSFVETVDAPVDAKQAPEREAAPSAAAQAEAAPEKPAAAPAETPAPEESRKKFSKKY
jgi:hypothetical protein